MTGTVFFFVEAEPDTRPRVRMTLCEDRAQAESCAAETAGTLRIHEIEASSAALAACKLVARHRARERDIRFFRDAGRRGARLRRLEPAAGSGDRNQAGSKPQSGFDL